ncbi:hypothetical protein Tco_0965279 [Tanacetum coccineum]
MANTQLPLLQELSRASDSHDIRDQLPVLFRREVVEDSKKDARLLQLDDMEMDSRLMLMAREMQTKVDEKRNFIVRLGLE